MNAFEGKSGAGFRLPIVDKKDRATTPQHVFQAIPDCLAQYRNAKRYCLWRWTPKGDGGDFSWIKPPYRKPDSWGSVSDPSDWMMRETAEGLARKFSIGLGLMLYGLEGLVALDLDNCIDAEGNVAEWAQQLVDKCGSYVELSPSGSGLRILGICLKLDSIDMSVKRPDSGKLEVFHNTERYITITGIPYGKPVSRLADLTHIVVDELGDKLTARAVKEERQRQRDETKQEDTAQAEDIDESTLPAWFIDLFKEPPAEDRSGQFHRICGKAKAQGLSIEQTAALFEKHGGGGFQKYADRNGGSAFEEVSRCWDKLDDQPKQRPVVIDASSAADVFDPWAEMRPKAFPLEVLPEVMRRFVQAKEEETGACPSAIAMSALGVASGALSHQTKLYLNRHNEFPVSPRLWVLLVGDPSQMKTPAQSGAIAPLRAIEREKQKVAEALNRLAKENDEDEQRLPRLILTDTTTEFLCSALESNPRGIMVHVDELSGFFGSFDRYSSGKGHAPRSTWLKAYDGGPYSVTRVGRQTGIIENLSVSILGGIQPDRLRGMKDLMDDGLLQRFISVMMRRAAMGQPNFDANAYLEYDKLITALQKCHRLPARCQRALKQSTGTCARCFSCWRQAMQRERLGSRSSGSSWATLATSPCCCITCTAARLEAPCRERRQRWRQRWCGISSCRTAWCSTAPS